jgi:hypothetical protein
LRPGKRQKPYLTTRAKKAGGVAQVVEHLLRSRVQTPLPPLKKKTSNHDWRTVLVNGPGWSGRGWEADCAGEGEGEREGGCGYFGGPDRGCSAAPRTAAVGRGECGRRTIAGRGPQSWGHRTPRAQQAEPICLVAAQRGGDRAGKLRSCVPGSESTKPLPRPRALPAARKARHPPFAKGARRIEATPPSMWLLQRNVVPPPILKETLIISESFVPSPR